MTMLHLHHCRHRCFRVKVVSLNHFTSRLSRSSFAQFRCQDKVMAKNMFEKGKTPDLLFIWAEDSLHFQPSFQQEYQVGPVSTNIELKD